MQRLSDNTYKSFRPVVTDLTITLLYFIEFLWSGPLQCRDKEIYQKNLDKEVTTRVLKNF